MKTMAMMKMMS